MAETSFDLVVIGAGPGGYVAAIRAAQLGMKTAVVEREHLGGICLNWGCIPAKTLLRSSDMYHEMTRASEFGLSVGEIGFDLEKIVARSRLVAKRLNSGIGSLLKKHKVHVVYGTACLTGKGGLTVTMDGKEVARMSAKHIILATGARARALPGLEPDGKLVWTYREAMTPDIMPKSLLVMGSGAIGIEFASFYRTLGAEVTVVEVLPRVLPLEDEEISGMALKQFQKQGMKVHTSTKVVKLVKGANNVTATLEAPDGSTSEITVDRMISAVGVQSNTENLGLENTKVKLVKGSVVTDKWCQTDEPGVYAIGDCAMPPFFAHKASHEGIICVEKIAGVPDVHPLDRSSMPACTYCRPQVASIGLSEAAAKEAGREIKVGRFPFVGSGKAVALGETEGMIKTIFDAKTGELLGAHMIGAEVTELIQGFGISKTLETTETELMHTIFPHPTLSEMMHESVLDAFGRAIHF